MNVLLLNNPKSGRGTGAALAQALAERLEEAGHAVTRIAAGPQLSTQALNDTIARVDLLVIAGGDGTLHHALPSLIHTGVPFYHYPLGTENLFTREFGMDQRPETLLRAIERWRIKPCDAGTCNGRPFSLMVGVGFDAGVVERLAAKRTGGTSRAEYVRHAIDEILHPRVPRLTVVVDDRPIITGTHGMLIAANSRQYAARLDPVRSADMSDGLLDLLFLPHSTASELGAWLLAVAAGSHLENDRVVTARGKTMRILTDEPTPHQIDGEAAGPAPKLAGSDGFGFELRTLPGVLRVLLP